MVHARIRNKIPEQVDLVCDSGTDPVQQHLEGPGILDVLECNVTESRKRFFLKRNTLDLRPGVFRPLSVLIDSSKPVEVIEAPPSPVGVKYADDLSLQRRTFTLVSQVGDKLRNRHLKAIEHA